MMWGLVATKSLGSRTPAGVLPGTGVVFHGITRRPGAVQSLNSTELKADSRVNCFYVRRPGVTFGVLTAVN
jgi:hypothetical protein